MTAVPIGSLPAEAFTRPDDETGFGILRTERGNLPLHRLDVRTRITGLTATVELTQGFRNTFREPLEATYIFPLPPRGALTQLTLTADDRVVQAQLQERGAAREAYDQAIAAGQRAAIAEEERPDVFTLRVGNILPGERVSVALRLVQPLALVDGEAEFRFPLVVAPRYIPGTALGGEQVGDGHAPDTDAVPDASRISPPVLLPGFPNPVALSLRAEVDPAGLQLTGINSSLHAVTEADGVIEIRPGERLDRDFILRLAYAGGSDALVLAPDTDGSGGTFQLIAFPPELPQPLRPRDVVLLLDRSGSMEGWKMVAARRAAARIVDTLRDGDRFAVLTFDHAVEHPDGLPEGLVAATDRNRYRAVEHLSRADARGGTELLEPLRDGLALLRAADRDRVLVLVTDGQVGNEEQILREVDAALAGVRVHTVGIDQAVNAGFLGRLAIAGRGRCELVESEDRLDAAMDRIHRRIGSPVVTEVRLDHTSGPADGTPDGPAAAGQIDMATVTGLGDLFPGVPLVVAGRYTGAVGRLALRGLTAQEEPWRAAPEPVVAGDDSATPVWARGYLRGLEDQYAVHAGPELEQRIVAASLRFGVLCRFTAFVAVDTRVVTEGGQQHRVVQPVEQPAGWQQPAEAMRVQSSMAPMSFVMPASSPFQPAPAPASARPAAPRIAGALAKKRRGGSTAAGPVAAPDVVPPPPGGAGQGYFGSARMREEEAVPETSAMLPGLLDVERTTLLTAAEAPVSQRRDLLDDLASRLDALAQDPIARVHRAALLRLVAALRDGSVPLARRWAQALALLTELVGGSAGAGPDSPAPDSAAPDGSMPGVGSGDGTPVAEVTPGGGRRRGAFWRR